MRAAFFDVDGTLTSERTWKGLLSYFQEHHLRRATHCAFLAIHYPLYLSHRLGLVSESGFRAPWAAHLAWYVRGYSVERANEVWEYAVDNYLSHYWRADTRLLLDEHCRLGDLVMLVSSGPQPMLEYTAKALGAQHAVGTRFEVRNGRYTGRYMPPVVIDQAKASAPQAYLQERGLQVDLKASFAYADSTTDLGLLEMVGNPMAVYPDKGLRAIAMQRGWRIFPG
jgi:putative phosphoserine phosphatase/1-acylglycerol-3-phosphate O-acyltransferase